MFIVHYLSIEPLQIYLRIEKQSKKEKGHFFWELFINMTKQELNGYPVVSLNGLRFCLGKRNQPCVVNKQIYCNRCTIQVSLHRVFSVM